ncbi:phosphonopyruvate decarboxylase-like [Physella acuta]|uniref:phosphonopyruvate decarboxylase-like n=1 Tax=Physella acuta TaxID=109671 RepID=UPI0027DCDCE6|nr:phosphonopyruvate decarboxylase-like [Physella acuta]
MSSVRIVCGLHRLVLRSAPLLQTASHVQNDHCQSFSTTGACMSPTQKPLDPGVFYQAVKDSGVNFFCGVPDSLLKDFCAYVTTTSSDKDHVITANEGAAVALASGYHLATGRTAMVYLQNSGLGNMVNPLMSLANPAVYSIPILLLVGWRGEPGVKDEPQHVAQGQITKPMLDCMNIPCEILPKDEASMRAVLKKAEEYFEDKKSPFALLVKSKTFSPYKLKAQDRDNQFPLTREEALFKVVECLQENDAVVGTTGMLSRELFEYRVTMKMGHARDFLTVGSMGHASAIALGIALQKPQRQVFCLDGDGALLMHMGSLATVGQQGPANLKHIVFNNGAHDSVGGQPTEAGNHEDFDLCAIAKGCGYKEALVAITEKEIEEKVRYLHKARGPILLELKVKLGSRSDLGRPTRTTIENKDDFMGFLRD